MGRIFFILVFIIALSLPAQAEMQKVLIINSYHPDFSWVADHNSALKQGLEGVAQVFVFNMDTKRLTQKVYQQQAERAFAQVMKIRPDAVVLADDYALQSLGKRLTDRGIPIIFLGINNNPRNYIRKMDLATGVLERPLLKRSIVYIREILGSTFTKCMVLFDNGITANTTVNQVFQGRMSQVFSNTTIDIKLNSRFSQWKENVLNAKKNGYSAIILGLYHTLVDENSVHVSDDVIARWTSAHSPVPVFGFWDFSVGKGLAIGGLVLDGTPQGEEAALLTRMVLKGKLPHTISPITAETGKFIFSRSELSRWDITLPHYFTAPNETITYVD